MQYSDEFVGNRIEGRMGHDEVTLNMEPPRNDSPAAGVTPVIAAWPAGHDGKSASHTLALNACCWQTQTAQGLSPMYSSGDELLFTPPRLTITLLLPAVRAGAVQVRLRLSPATFTEPHAVPPTVTLAALGRSVPVTVMDAPGKPTNVGLMLVMAGVAASRAQQHMISPGEMQQTSCRPQARPHQCTSASQIHW